MTTKHEHEHAAKTTKHGKPLAPERGVCTCRQAQDGKRVPSADCPLHTSK